MQDRDHNCLPIIQRHIGHSKADHTTIQTYIGWISQHITATNGIFFQTVVDHTDQSFVMLIINSLQFFINFLSQPQKCRLFLQFFLFKHFLKHAFRTSADD